MPVHAARHLRSSHLHGLLRRGRGLPGGHHHGRLRERGGGGQWHKTLVDTEGGYPPKLGFFASGKRFVVYRTLPAVTGPGGVLKLAVER